MNEAQTQATGTMRGWLEALRTRFAEALPKNTIDIDRFIAAAAMEILGNPKLMACTKASLTQSLIQSARYGLEVGALLGQAWIIPYNESKRMEDGSWQKVMTAHFQLGYKGLVALARRSKTIRTISAKVVYENDMFEVDLGLHPTIVHKLDIRSPRGNPIAYYCVVELDNGGIQFEVLTHSDILAHRDQYSKGYGQSPKDNPWTTSLESMALKTVVVKTLKLCPMSVEALEAVGMEERAAIAKDVTPATATLPQYDSLPDPSTYIDTDALPPESLPAASPAPEPVKAETPTQAKAKAIFQRPKAAPVTADWPAVVSPSPMNSSDGSGGLFAEGPVF